jgi:23S rRNA pseudouridine2605 synthase
MKLQQYIARCGITSRRKAEELISHGQIKVNGSTITKPGFEVNPEKDAVKFEGRLIKPERMVYLVLNKPQGCVTTVSDDRGRKTVTDIVGLNMRIFPAGRLDYNTTGCLLMTNDGDWANKITHPRSEVRKVYVAKIKGRLNDYALNKLKKGIKIGGRFLTAKDVGIYQRNNKNDVIYIAITEGINHQVKLMMAAAGIPPVWLKRTSVGTVNVDGLEPGQWRFLTKKEISFFDKQVIRKPAAHNS